MANEEQLKILKQGVTVWNQWREEHPDETIDLSNAHLYKANLRGVILEEARLVGTCLNKANLQEANLQKANLDVADLFGANLQEATLFGAQLYNVNLYNANLQGAELFDAYLKKANLERANLEGADLQEADLIQTNLTHATITGAKLYGTARDDWIIDGIKCDYVCWDFGGKERTPKDKDFRPGEFEELYKQFPTFEFVFEHGITLVDIAVIDRIINELHVQHPTWKLKIDSFHSRGQPHAKFTVSHKEHLVEAEKRVKEDYEARLASLEGKQEQLMEIVSTLINKPQYIGRDYIAISEKAQVNKLTTGESKDETTGEE